MSIKACVLGSPVRHSLSPALHGYWLKKYGIDGRYVALETATGDLSKTLADLAARGFAGGNLTMPLKESALALMDDLDHSAAAVGAVNTVVIKDGKMTGYNSDGFGFIAGLAAKAPHWKKRRATLIGAGGAARAVAAALKNEGVQNFSFLCRTPAKAEKIIDDLGLNGRIVSSAPDDTSLLVNCTPRGMAGYPSLDIDPSPLPPDAVVCDIVTSPSKTSFLSAAAGRGLATVNGLPMLLHQGRMGFQYWFGIDPDVTPELEGEIASCLK